MTHMPEAAVPRIVTGAEYLRQITTLESDRRARTAFQHLALKIAPPGAALLDFGAGTGLDTRFYAEHGFTVVAYDVDAEMCGFFAEYCSDLIESGRVMLNGGPYRDFLERKAAASAHTIDLVTSNFAPLNLIGDLRKLFAKFHALTGPNGKVLASVLSPYFIGDLKYRWWWRNSLRLWRDGSFSVPGAQGPIVRRRLADLAHQCAPYFALRRVFPGLPTRAGRHPSGVPVRGDVRNAWLRVATCRYMFLLFEKRSDGAGGVRH